MENPTVQNSVFFFPCPFLSARGNYFRKTARDFKKLPVTFLGKIKLPVLKFSKFSYFSNNKHVRWFFKSETYFEVPVTILERVPVM